MLDSSTSDSALTQSSRALPSLAAFFIELARAETDLLLQHMDHQLLPLAHQFFVVHSYDPSLFLPIFYMGQCYEQVKNEVTLGTL